MAVLKLGGLVWLPEYVGLQKAFLMLTVTSSSFQSQTGPWPPFWGVFKASCCRGGTAARSEGETWIWHLHDMCVAGGLVCV